ncbi:MAG: non-heme iron oxygenase ferredoxin subunit [Nitrososphaeraceae archaeon]
MSEWMKVCELKSLKNNEIFEFDYEEKKILIVSIGDKIYASDRICTHAYADLSTGFLNVSEKSITCPLHMSIFKLDDGIPQNLPAKEPLKLYETKIENGDVYLLI